jgi:hypothetical protein
MQIQEEQAKRQAEGSRTPAASWVALRWEWFVCCLMKCIVDLFARVCCGCYCLNTCVVSCE